MADKEKTEAKKKVEKEKTEPARFKGKYYAAVGRRKSSVARVRLYKKGSGVVMVNDKKLSAFYPADIAAVIKQPLKMTGQVKETDVSIIVKGGGSRGQAEAIRHAIARCFIQMEPELKPALKAKGWVTRDSRDKERKKPGLKKARRAPQWAKR